ncbi:MAG: hypothetical protein AAGB93_23030 [Planctomycetota bacterium]
MSETQRVMERLIAEVVALSESTRNLAVEENDPFGALEVLRARHEAIGQSIAELGPKARPQPVAYEPPAPLPAPRPAPRATPRAEVVESLDELFGTVDFGDE